MIGADELAVIVEGRVPGLDDVVRGVQPGDTGETGVGGVSADIIAIGGGGFGEEMVFAFDDEDGAVAVGVVDVLVDDDHAGVRIYYTSGRLSGLLGGSLMTEMNDDNV